MKNVCFFNTVKFWGGGEKLHLEYALKFKERGYRVFLATSKNSPLSQKGLQGGLLIFNIYAGNLSFLNPVKYFRLYRWYRKEKIDTVIFSSSQDVKLGSFSARLAGVTNIVYLRGLAAPVKNSFVNRFLFNHALTHIVANSEETKRTILKNLQKSVAAEKVKVIYHGIDLKDFDSRIHPEINPAYRVRPGIVLGNAGRLTSQKGQHLLIEIANRLKQKNIRFTLFIAGTGEMKATLEELIDKYNLHKEVVLLGFVEDVENFMHAIDIFILTSIWEGFGYVIVEAMAARKPTIAFDISSNPEIIINNQTGFLVEYPDLETFSGKLETLINDENLRLKFGNQGRETVERQFQLDDRITDFERYLLSGE
ncbi:MAG: glycosyltransferase [Bacteroidetes bacterium]|nr:glycosyltransferase [Bacteroidota bacterium]